MKFNKSLIIISISILPCSLYPFNLVTARHAAQSTPALIARVSTVSKFVISAIYTHKYVSSAALFMGAILLYPPIRRTITDFLKDLLAPLWRRNHKETMDDVRHKAWLMGIDFDGIQHSRDPVKEMIKQVQAAQSRAASKESATNNVTEHRQTSLHRKDASHELKHVNTKSPATPNPSMQDYDYAPQPEADRSFCLANAHALVPQSQMFQLPWQVSHPLPAHVVQMLQALSAVRPAPPQPLPAATLRLLQAFRGPIVEQGTRTSQDQSRQTVIKDSSSTTKLGTQNTSRGKKKPKEIVMPQTISTGEYGTWQKCLVRVKKS